MDNLAQRAKEIIKNNLYVAIATSSGDQPWNTPVYAGHDDQYNFFWRSWISAEHSKNIKKNKNIFIVIYDSTRELGTNHQQCVYIKAKAYELNDKDEIGNALVLFVNNDKTTSDFVGESVTRVYKAVPEQIWLNDRSERQVTKETVKMRVEVPLKDLLSL